MVYEKTEGLSPEEAAGRAGASPAAYRVFRSQLQEANAEVKQLNSIIDSLTAQNQSLADQAKGLQVSKGNGGEGENEGGGGNSGGDDKGDKNRDKFKEEKEWRERQQAEIRISYARGEADYEQYQKRLEESEVEYGQRILSRSDLTAQERITAEADYYEAIAAQTKAGLLRTKEAEDAAFEEQKMALQQRYIDGESTTETYQEALRMLELEPAMRYPTYKSLAGDISRFIAKAGQSKSARLASGKFKIKGAKIRIKPTGAPRVVGEQEGEEQQPYVKPLVEEKPERRTNLGKMVALTVLGVVLAIVGTVGGLLWYVKANAEKKQRAEQAGYAKDAADARNAIANTVARTDEFAANFHDMVVRNDRLMADAVRKMRAELPAEYKVAAGAILEPVPSKEIADAIAYTNKLLSAKQGQTAAAPDAAKKPDDAKKDDAKKADGDKAKADAEKKGGDKAKDAKAGKKPAAQDSAIDDDEADKIEKPEEDVKAAVAANPEVAAKIAAAKATAIAMAKASGAEVSAVEVKTIAVKLPAAVVKFGDLWADVFVCRAADIRVQGHVKRIKAMAAAADEIKASDAAAAEALARISQEVLEEHERMKGLKHVELAQRKAGVVRNNSQSYVKTAVIQLANAKAKKEKEARDAAERKAREEKEQAEKELREKLKAEEPKAAADKFDSLAQTLLKTLEWDKAIRQLKAMSEVFKTPEGREEARSQMTKVECMKGLQEHFVKFAKNFKFKDGSIVKAVDGKGLTIQKLKSVRGRMEPDKIVKVEWERFYGKLEYVGYMDQLINTLVIKGRDTTKIGPLLWSRHMLGAALTLKHLYGEVPGAEQKAPILVKTAVKEFSDSAKWAKKWFPDVETETNEQ